MPPQLNPYDEFNVIAYNDTQFPFSAGMVLAEPEALEAAALWIGGLQVPPPSSRRSGARYEMRVGSAVLVPPLTHHARGGHRRLVAVLTSQASSTTEILPPLQNATEMLSTAKGVPYIFLITDGAVR